jgi:hypothetical protein
VSQGPDQGAHEDPFQNPYQGPNQSPYQSPGQNVPTKALSAAPIESPTKVPTKALSTAPTTKVPTQMLTKGPLADPQSCRTRLHWPPQSRLQQRCPAKLQPLHLHKPPPNRSVASLVCESFVRVRYAVSEVVFLDGAKNRREHDSGKMFASDRCYGCC